MSAARAAAELGMYPFAPVRWGLHRVGLGPRVPSPAIRLHPAPTAALLIDGFVRTARADYEPTLDLAAL